MEVTSDFARYALTVSTAPAVEPLTATEAKLHLRVTSTSEDEHIRRCITAARQYTENVDGRTYVATSYQLRLDCFPCGSQEIALPRPPLRSITSIAYIDATGATATLTATQYTVDTYSQPGRLVPAYGTYWPSTRDEPNAVTITFSAGYGTTASSVPDSRKVAMLFLIGHWYANRESVQVGQIAGEIAQTFNAIIGADRGSYL